MTFIRRIDNKIVGYTPYLPPSSETDLWQEVKHDDNAELLSFLQPIQSSTQNWKGLENTLRGSSTWSRTFQAAMKSVAGNACMTILLSALSATHSIEDLTFSVRTLRQVMVSQAALSDFTEDELAFVREALESNGFDAAVILD